jgi:hypothetical protein
MTPIKFLTRYEHGPAAFVNRFIAATLLALLSSSLFAGQGTASIPLVQRGGVYEIEATLNGAIKANFVVDYWTPGVTISRSLAKLLISSKTLTASDLVGDQKNLRIDDGIGAGTVVMLRQLNLGGVSLGNVWATVVESESTPLYLGQSALARLTHWTINRTTHTFDVSIGNDSGDTRPFIVHEEPDWIRFLESNGASFYASKATIHRTGSKVTIRMKMDLAFRSDKNDILSSKSKKQFDCSNETYRTISTIDFLDHSGGGEVVNSDYTLSTWSTVVPASAEAALYGIVCKNGIFPGKTAIKDLGESPLKRLECANLKGSYKKATESKADWSKALKILGEFERSCSTSSPLGYDFFDNHADAAYHYTEAYFENQMNFEATESANECIRLNTDVNDREWDKCIRWKLVSLARSGNMTDAIAEASNLARSNMERVEVKSAQLLTERNLEKSLQLELQINGLEGAESAYYFALGNLGMAIDSANQCLVSDSAQPFCFSTKFWALYQGKAWTALLPAIDHFAGDYQLLKIAPLKKALEATQSAPDKVLLTKEISERESFLSRLLVKKAEVEKLAKEK